jgi:formylmethanofuran dehydrogenase subunit B
MGCACLCDDIQVTIRDNRVIHVELACELGRPSFETERVQGPEAIIAGAPCDGAAAVVRAVGLIKSARSLLITGLRTESVETQFHAARLALQARAVIDPWLTTFERAWLDVERTTGWLTGTWSEMQARADLVILLDVDPDRTHPRWRERFLPPGPIPRKIVYIGEANPVTPVDQWIRYSSSEWVDRLPFSALADSHSDSPCAAAMEIACCVTLVVGDSSKLDAHATCSSSADADSAPASARVRLRLETLARWARNSTCEDRRRLVIPLTGPANPWGAALSLTALTGGPMAMDCREGVPRFDPIGALAPRLIDTAEVDLVLFVGSASGESLETLGHVMDRIPTIWIGPQAVTQGGTRAAVAIASDRLGIEQHGAQVRSDGTAVESTVGMPISPTWLSAGWTLSGILKSLADGEGEHSP